jgi:hypothetical protein
MKYIIDPKMLFTACSSQALLMYVESSHLSDTLWAHMKLRLGCGKFMLVESARMSPEPDSAARRIHIISALLDVIERET